MGNRSKTKSSDDWVRTMQPVKDDQGKYWVADPDWLPPERKTVLVWIEEEFLPRLGYVRYAAGDKDSPYWVVYTARKDHHLEDDSDPVKVVAYLDCVPQTRPSFLDKNMKLTPDSWPDSKP